MIFFPGKYAGQSMMQAPTTVDILPKSRGMFPLGMKHSSYYVKSRIALIGDSAHRIHPMAGQGVNLGFGDAKCLADTIKKSQTYGNDHGKDFGLACFFHSQIYAKIVLLFPLT